MLPATPGVRKMREYTLRVFSGSSRMRRLSTTLPMVEVVVSSWTASALTCTESVTSPTARTISFLTMGTAAWMALLALATAAFGQPARSPRPDRAGNPFAGNADAAVQGEKLYGARCAGCHGKDARGGEAPNLYKSRVVVSAP